MEHEERLRAALADRYRIDRVIGSGGMATVYLAQDLKHERQVAVKVLNPVLAESLGAERFLREIKTAANLTHPHILPVHDSGEADGFLFYVMPFVAGESLRARLTKERQLPVEDAVQIAREIADALAHAHEAGVIHRDVKPANIMLEAGHAVLADFGVAHAVSEARGERLTRTGTSLGTPSYMSPEQASGDVELDGRSDQYALGCVLYEMLAGQPPFSGAQFEAVVRQHVLDEPPSVRKLRPTVPTEVEDAINRALAKSPADRFRTAADFGAALATAPAQAAASSVTKVRGFPGWAAGAVAGMAVILLGIWILGGRDGPGPASGAAEGSSRLTVAVLPLDDLSPDPAHAYFAPSLHDELLTQLSKVGALGVISRTSVMEYAERTVAIGEIADSLNATHVVEGSVTVLGDRLRVNVQLIDAATDQHAWADTYEKTLDDAFAILGEIAQSIVSEVGATLGADELRALQAVPTQNAEASQFYLQALDYLGRSGRRRENYEAALDLLERAATLDPGFALARTRLSTTHGFFSWYGWDVSPDRSRRQLAEAELALELASDMPEAHMAMGVYHYHQRDWSAALERLELALQGLPNSAALWLRIGYLHRREGNWDQADMARARAQELNPRSTSVWEDLGGGTFTISRRYPEAVQAYERALILAPDLHLAAIRRAHVFLRWRGEFDSLVVTLDGFSQDVDLGPAGTGSYQHAEYHRLNRQPDSVLAVVQAWPQPEISFQNAYVHSSLYEGWAHQMTGNTDLALASFNQAREFFDSLAREIPEDWRVHASLGLALAGLGERGGALREADWLQESEIYQDDAFLGPRLRDARGMILAQIGEADLAIEEVERLLSRPSWVSAHTFRLDPRWDSLREDPRFMALLERYSAG
jgi:serine/threonine-protein kinase